MSSAQLDAYYTCIAALIMRLADDYDGQLAEKVGRNFKRHLLTLALSRVPPQCMSEITEYHDRGDLPRPPYKEVFAQAEQPIGWSSE